MILIIQNELEAKIQLAGLALKYREDKFVYKEFVDLYEINFEKFLAETGRLKHYNRLKESCGTTLFFDPENPFSKERYKLMTEFNVVRPYYYQLKGKFYFFRSTLVGFKEANIFELSSEDVLNTLEKEVEGFGFLEKLRRARNQIKFISIID